MPTLHHAATSNCFLRLSVPRENALFSAFSSHACGLGENGACHFWRNFRHFFSVFSVTVDRKPQAPFFVILQINGLAVDLSSEFYRDQHARQDSNCAPQGGLVTSTSLVAECWAFRAKEKTMFLERGPNETIFFTGGRLVRRSMREGDIVTLRSGDQSVLVRDLHILGPDHYAGTIYGFEPSHVTELNGLRLDERIEFHDKNIFGVDLRE